MSEHTANLQCALEPNDIPPAPPALRTRGESRRYQPQTIGFPTLRSTSKRVMFDPPLYAKCISIDGAWCIDCLVVTVWESGAQIKITRANDLTEFLILFTSSRSPVRRRCKKVATYGNRIEVEFERKQPSYSMHLERD